MSGRSSDGKAVAKTINWPLAALTAALLAVSATEYWILFSWDGVALADKVSVALAIIGAYGLGLGFFGRMASLDAASKGVIAELVSPNAALCVAGNMTYLGTLLNMAGLALPGRRRNILPVVLYLLSGLALMVMALGVLAYGIIHAVIVVPISYPAVLVAASVVNGYEATAPDVKLSVTDSARTISTPGSLRDLVVEHRAAATAFIMGLPAIIIALAGRVVAPFL